MALDSQTWRERFKVHSHEVDLNGFVHPHIMLCYLLDTAGAHVRGSQFSYEYLHGEGQLWVLSRFYAVFYKYPKWTDEITIETWGKAVDKLFGLRDFIVASSSDEKLIAATSAWLLIDRKTNRPQRLEKLKENFPFQLDKNELNIKLEKLPPLTSGKTSGEYRVHHTDIDLNRHVNSSKYMQWMLDSFPPEILLNQKLCSFEINFLSEAKIEDTLFIVSEESGDFYLSEVKRKRDNTVLCRARLKWGK